MRHVLRVTLVLILPVTAGCQPGPSAGHDSYPLSLPVTAAHALVVKLGACPSPLKRLGIAVPAWRLDQSKPNAVTITVAGSDASAPIVLRFKIEAGGNTGAASSLVRYALSLPDSAQELELDQGQLITPHAFTEQLGEALEGYFALNNNHETARPFDNREKTAQQCRKIGRLLDDGAVMISPALSAEVRRQRRRDAINWLFKDEYQLRTDSISGSNSY